MSIERGPAGKCVVWSAGDHHRRANGPGQNRCAPTPLFPQDVGFPYMMSTRTPPDTLHLFFESDFRFWKSDCRSWTEWVEPLGRRRARAEPVAGRMRGLAPYYEEARDAFGIAPELIDLVSICNQAARAKTDTASRASLGHCVWLSWNAAEVGQAVGKHFRGHRISYGSQAIAFTKQGAAALHKLMTEDGSSSTHFDLWLKWVLTDGKFEGASYVVPPVGGYLAHNSI
mmetsp:Transcript_49192/g.136681  ORF Transcript_49192/g.136681 Transcript_49192/m.136681 type:complete len:228 (-) Transcript_49192:147-830(-)